MAHSSGIYQPLARGQIRLLQIFSGSGTDPRLPVSVALRTVDLEADPLPEFMALSYEWGCLPRDVPGTPLVKINGRPFKATTSLSYALVYLRAKFGTALFWIDAICINQQDDEEKGHQVSLMYQIYNKASWVIVWLGMAGRESDRAMKFLQEAMHHSRMSPNGNPEVDEEWLLPRLIDPPDGMYDTWKAVLDLCGRSYWTRCWIIQEIVAARMVSLVCGAEMAHMMVFFALIEGFILNTAKYFHQVRPGYHDLVQLANPVLGLLTTALDDDDNPCVSRDLLQIWERFASSRASDPRDKIYSLVGMARPRTDIPLQPRYGAAIPDVYKEVAAYIIRDSGRLDLLANAGHGLPSHVLPTWVPDWSCDNHFSNAPSNWRPGQRNVLLSKRNWACSGPPDETIPNVTFGVNNSTVEVQAMIVCPVREFAPLVDESRDKVSSIHKLEFLLDFLLAEYKKALQDDHSHDVLDAISVHLCANLYDMLFCTIMLPDEAKKQWSTLHFAQTCFSLIPELRQDRVRAKLTPQQEEMLSSALSCSRVVFVCHLPYPFSLARSIKRTVANLDPQVESKLQQISFFQTFGLSREYNINIGDSVAVIKGCAVPIILRRPKASRPRRASSLRKIFKREAKAPVERREKWEVASEAYLQGIMRGEVVGVIAEQTIALQ